MYMPAHFEETRRNVLQRLVEEYPLGTLISCDDSGAGLNADHLPFEWHVGEDGNVSLRAHVARANPVWQRLAAGRESLVVFQGPQTYISPSLYPSKQAHGKVVPTYNYMVVHAHGPVRALDDKAWLLELVSSLTRRHEANQSLPWEVSDAPLEFIDQMLANIVGIEMRVTRIEGKWKISQNRSAADKASVRDALSKGNEDQRRMSDALGERIS